MIRNKNHNAMPVIDLTGPNGNAFALLGNARNWAKELGFPKERADKIIAEMTSGDYENLVAVLDENFGEYVIFER